MVMARSLFICLLCLAFSTLCNPSQISSTTICQIKKNPTKYNGRIVRIRVWVNLDWEHFEAWDENCKQEAITLAYPDDPNVQPRPHFPLQKDEEYELFQKLVAAKKYPAKSAEPGAMDSHGDPTLALPLYKVQATIVGRLDSGIIRGPDDRLPHTKAYGHMDEYFARLVIRSESATPPSQ
jgi:hypothetical protein